jgi:Rrf2 family nitric oxide-sensitive transcriptional repressor
MYITRYTDYSLRVLMYVALKNDELSTIREIAESYDVSKNHLMKVVQGLNNKGYLQATRGKNGGLRLKGNPKQINLGELVRSTEQDLTLVECFGGTSQCVLTPSCRLKGVFAEALEAFFHVLDRYTLADLVNPRNASEIKQLLRLA